MKCLLFLDERCRNRTTAPSQFQQPLTDLYVHICDRMLIVTPPWSSCGWNGLVQCIITLLLLVLPLSPALLSLPQPSGHSCASTCARHVEFNPFSLLPPNTKLSTSLPYPTPVSPYAFHLPPPTTTPPLPMPSTGWHFLNLLTDS